MDWTLIVLAVTIVFLVYAVSQVVMSFTWSAEKSARLRRGPTNSPGETIWLLLSAVLLAALSVWSLGGA